MLRAVTNVVIAGLGGQGVITASDVLARAAFRAGFDVKKSETHGMSQRGGSVHSDVRFGDVVLSPMITPGEADYLLVLEAAEVEPARHLLRPGGELLEPDHVDARLLPSKKSLNVALLALLSRRLPIGPDSFHAAIRESFKPELSEVLLPLFDAVRG
jgi:indolepyruvate ferredoxin oxidoreductase beta subunit